LSEPARSESHAVAHDRPAWVGKSSRPLVLTAVIATIMISAIEINIIATVMPTIVGELGGFDLFAWAFTAYSLTQGVTIPIYGRLADIYGRKRVLLIAIGLFLAGSILCGLAWSMTALVAFRIVQGIGAGGLVPISQTVVGDLYSPAERARMQGYISSIWAMGSIIGPLVGAFLVAFTIWPMVFWINVPIGAAAALMLMLWLKEDVEHHERRIDYLGSALLMVGTGALMLALVQATKLSVPAFAGLIGSAIALIVLFFLHERRAPEPMLPISLLKNRVIAAGNVTCFAVGAIMMGSTAFLSLDVQGVMGRSALAAGMVIAAPSISWPIGSALGGWLMIRTSYRTTALVGAVPMILGIAMMIALDASRGPLWAGTGGAFIGIGMGLTNNTYTVAIQGIVDWSQRGVATSTISFARILGQSLGAAVFGGTINAALAARGAAGDVVDRLLDPTLRRSMTSDAIAPLMSAIAEGIHNVYLITGVLVLVVLLVAVTMPAGLSPIRGIAKRS
jgi:EmrB/QacA subfamily drug resistance transporter